MKYQEHTTKSGHKIKVWDDLYDYASRVAMLRGICESDFKFRSTYDNELENQEGTWSVYCDLNLNLTTMMLVDKCPELKKEFAGYMPIRSWVNSSTKETDHAFHPDADDETCKSMLYYANIKWDHLNWDGYTIWRTPNLEDIEFVSDFVPGRIVVFDSIIPHKASIASKRAHPFRFTINTIWKPIE